MSYSVKQGKTGYNIIEKDTDLTIELERSEKEARDLCRKMNLGSGFNGWTPTFFTPKMNVNFEEA
jgi:hypothetical protein